MSWKWGTNLLHLSLGFPNKYWSITSNITFLQQWQETFHSEIQRSNPMMLHCWNNDWTQMSLYNHKLIFCLCSALSELVCCCSIRKHIAKNSDYIQIFRPENPPTVFFWRKMLETMKHTKATYIPGNRSWGLCWLVEWIFRFWLCLTKMFKFICYWWCNVYFNRCHNNYKHP